MTAIAVLYLVCLIAHVAATLASPTHEASGRGWFLVRLALVTFGAALAIDRLFHA